MADTIDPLRERVAIVENDIRHVRDDVSTLKADVREMRTDIGTLKTDMATVKERIAHLPTKDWAVGALLKLAAVIVALSVISTAATVFAPKLQKLVGAL